MTGGIRPVFPKISTDLREANLEEADLEGANLQRCAKMLSYQ